MSHKIGLGFDAHKLSSGRLLVLGGVKIPFSRGLEGHSDADVLCHAIIDALLGAAALSDIGTHFPDSDPKYKGISSLKLLARTGDIIKDEGYKVGNLDTVVLSEEPKLAPWRDKMRENISSALDIDIKQVSVKATTAEGMGFTGRGEGISAQAIVLIEKAGI